MEAILKKRALFPTSARPAAMAVHAASHAISKPKPKIRIIHIFAPEIIKTDVANFRELVQRLTGKPATATATETAVLEEKMVNPPGEIPAGSIGVAFDHRKMESGGDGGCRRSVKEEEEEEELNDVVGMWNDVVGLEGFIEELGEFPLLPSAHQLLLGFEEPQFV